MAKTKGRAATRPFSCCIYGVYFVRGWGLVGKRKGGETIINGGNPIKEQALTVVFLHTSDTSKKVLLCLQKEPC